MMIFVILKMTVRPEKRRDFIGTMMGMLEPVRVERGCLSYCLYEEIENRNIFILVGEWETQEDLERHIRTDNHLQLLTLMDLLSEQPELRFNTVSHTAGMELVGDVLSKTPGVR
jgi:quinol monooxygenase YgiN